MVFHLSASPSAALWLQPGCSFRHSCTVSRHATPLVVGNAQQGRASAMNVAWQSISVHSMEASPLIAKWPGMCSMMSGW